MIWILLISMDQHIWLLMSCAGPGHSAHEWLWFLAKSMPQVWHTWIWWTLGISFIRQMNHRCLKIYWTSIPPSVSLPLAVARWYILQVKCPKQRQQKEPQSDHERKIAAVLTAWFGCFREILGQHSPGIGSGQAHPVFLWQSIGWIYCGLGTLIQSFTCSVQLNFLNLIKTGFELGPSPSNSIPVIRLCLQTSPTGILRGDEMNINRL